MDADQNDKIAQFTAVTGASVNAAQTALASANWNLEEAVALYLAAQDEPQEDDDETEEPQPTSSMPRPPQHEQPTVERQRRPPGQRPKQMTLRDLQGGGDDDDEDEDKDQNLFAGGEKSGLAVENPDSRRGPADHFRNIMNQARQNRERPGGEDEEEPQRRSNFTGRAQTLGGDDAESRVIDDPTTAGQSSNQGLQRVTRTLHLWADGVSIDDGPLYRFDDPANQDIMAQINQGRAPLALLDIQPNQPVDLNLSPHKDENYVKPKQKYQAFGGQGQRLGSPTPGPAPSSSSSSFTTTSAAAAPAAATPSTQKPAEMQIDENTPTIQLQIRLGDGTQLRSRFNTTHTVGDLYQFVDRAAATQRPYALMTTFPSKELTDKGQVLGEMGEYKRGGVVVQKWK